MNDIKLNLDKIKARAPKVYDQLIGALALAGIHTTTGEVTITPAQWRHLSAVHGKLIPVLQAIVNEHERHCGCNDCFNKYVAEQMQSESERLKLVAQSKAAAQRLLQYMKEQGLRDNENNRQKWAEFESKLPRDVSLSPELIDTFISGWRSVLEWDAVAPAPAPAAPEPELAVLSGGTRQKPLDETPNSGWSVAQLKDWSKRSDAQKLFRAQQYSGASRSNFFKPDSQVI